MTTLFSSDIYKLLRNKAAIFGIIGSIALSVGLSLISYYSYIKRGAADIPFYGQEGVEILGGVSSVITFWLAVFVAFFVASEFQYGTVRSEISLGKPRTWIYFSKFLCTVIIFASAFLAVSVTMTLINTILYNFGDMSAVEFISYFAWNYFMRLLFALPCAAIFCAIAFIGKSPALTIAFGVMYMFVMAAVTQLLLGYINVEGPLNLALRVSPEYYGTFFGKTDSLAEIGAIGVEHFTRDSIIVCTGYIAAACALGCLVFSKKDVK
ncbi:MAG: ABC transporter permease [Clostridiales bacterium]|jgi:ABC-type transport system involved in multi-copper enzyme maturation permease subunit|nr:ABC transporter permease [Clostridiales bacterium]